MTGLEVMGLLRAIREKEALRHVYHREPSSSAHWWPAGVQPFTLARISRAAIRRSLPACVGASNPSFSSISPLQPISQPYFSHLWHLRSASTTTTHHQVESHHGMLQDSHLSITRTPSRNSRSQASHTPQSPCTILRRSILTLQ
jgi:hypothetical protein